MVADRAGLAFDAAAGPKWSTADLEVAKHDFEPVFKEAAKVLKDRKKALTKAAKHLKQVDAHSRRQLASMVQA